MCYIPYKDEIRDFSTGEEQERHPCWRKVVNVEEAETLRGNMTWREDSEMTLAAVWDGPVFSSDCSRTGMQ